MTDQNDTSPHAVIERRGFADWSWTVYNWHPPAPWWVKPIARGSRMTERRAERAAQRAMRDEARRHETRRQVGAF